MPPLTTPLRYFYQSGMEISFLKAPEWALLHSHSWKPPPPQLDNSFLVCFFKVLPHIHASLNSIFCFACFSNSCGMELFCYVSFVTGSCSTLGSASAVWHGIGVLGLAVYPPSVNGHLGRRLWPRCCCGSARLRSLTQPCSNFWIRVYLSWFD